MASTYSDLKIELIGTGEQSGTWGTTTNTNLGTAIEEAITGSEDVSFSSADVTLTLTDTNTTQAARNLRLNLTGTSGGARNLVVPAIEKVYIINNGLADAVTVKNSTGTGIAVPAGKTMYLYNDSTNVVDAITHLSSLTLATALPLTSGGTGATTDANARTNLGLGSMAVQNATSISVSGGTITGITDITVADGGTGASNATDARANLSAAKTGSNNDITELTGLTVPLSVAQGGTGINTSTGTGSVVRATSPTIASATLSDPTLSGTATAPTQSSTDDSTKIATTAFVQDLIGGTASAAGYIAFNGSTGSVIASSNLTLTKNGTGDYTINIDAGIQDGNADYCVVLGNVDRNTLSQGTGVTSASNTLNIYNTMVYSRATASFNVRAIRAYNVYQVFSAADGDGNATQMFGVTSVDPTYVTAVLYT
jgi:hypothetical protein